MRYGFAVVVFGILIADSLVLNHFSIRINQSVPVIIGLVATAWYAGLGPGILLSILIEAISVLLTPIPPDSTVAQTYFGYISVLLVLVFVVVLVSGRKRVDRRLRQQGELLQVTLSSIGDAVIATDVDGRISFLNPTAEALTGWALVDAKDLPIDEIFKIANEIDREKPVESPFALVKEKGSVVGLANHTILISKDGREIPIDDSGAPIRDGDGKIIGVVIVFHDVSENRRHEREREALLQSETAARAEAETANRLKDEFLSTVSHELRTPLNAIIGWAGLLKNRSVTDAASVENALAVIDRNARAQNKLIDDILDISRIMSGKVKLDVKPVDLVGALDAAVETVYPTAVNKKVAIKRSYNHLSPIVRGDAERMQQIFWNLLSNAVKFTPELGEINVEMSVSDGHVVVNVRDNGYGIELEMLAMIFDRFRQIDSSTRRQHGGLGLGLSIVRNLVELHGGTVTARSEGIGKGSNFTVALPLESDTQELIKKKIEERSTDLDGIKVLVVDDNQDNLDICRIGLEQFGAETRGADSCSAALPIFSAWRPDVLVSDLGMPHEDGFDLISKIRAFGSDAGGDIPAAAVTAYARIEDREKALAAGFQAHVAKPVDIVELASEILRILSDSRKI